MIAMRLFRCGFMTTVDLPPTVLLAIIVFFGVSHFLSGDAAVFGAHVLHLLARFTDSHSLVLV